MEFLKFNSPASLYSRIFIQRVLFC